MTPTERKRLQRDREKAGLVLLQAWVPSEKLQACMDAIDQITKGETK
jgi:hypothetical protein